MHRGQRRDDKRPSRASSPYLRPSRMPKVIFAILSVACVLYYLVPLASSLSEISQWQLGASKSTRERALRILKDHPTIDGHNDLAFAVRMEYGNHIYADNFTSKFEDGGLGGNVDLPRIDAGRYSGAFWSVFYLCPVDPFDFSNEAYEPNHQIDLMHRLSLAYPKYFSSTPSTSAAWSNFKAGKLISPLGIEGLHQIGNSYTNLRRFYELGVRYATLNWNCHNIYTDAAAITYLGEELRTVPSSPKWGGVSLKGRQLIREMNRLGMIVDLAHVSDDTMRDVLVGKHNDDFPIDGTDEEEWHGSIAPPIFSHSSARSICPHPRNVPDDIFPLVKQRNSVIMVNVNPEFISCHYEDGADPKKELPTADPKGATLDKVIEHIMYIGEKAGYDHVGLGTDFDGIETTPTGFDGVDKLPDLVAGLLDKGVRERDVVKILGGNVLRVWKEVEQVSAKLKKQGRLPAEDPLKPIWDEIRVHHN